jgi:hypothetical protein
MNPKILPHHSITGGGNAALALANEILLTVPQVIAEKKSAGLNGQAATLAPQACPE